MKTDDLEYKFLALVNKDDEYYQNILGHIKENHASIIDKNELDTGVEFRLKFTSEEQKKAFVKAIFPKDIVTLAATE